MAAIDAFTSHRSLLDTPAEHAFEITTNDNSDLPFITRYIWVGGGGDVHVIMLGGEEVTFRALAAGTLLRIRARKVFQTGTDATQLVGMY